jgi:hypothetical protein
MHESFASADVQPKRLALFTGVFVAGMIGGAVFASSVTHSQPSRPMAVGQVSEAAVVQAPIVSPSADPSVPDAGTALKQRKNERPEHVAPTF